MTDVHNNLADKKPPVMHLPVVIDGQRARHQIVADFTFINARELRVCAFVLPHEFAFNVEAGERGQPAGDVARAATAPTSV